MNVLGYVGFVGLSLVVAVGVKWYDPTVVAQLSRRTGLDGPKGWGVTLLATLWMFLPVLAGASTGDGDLWVVGSALAGGGFYLGVIAVTSLDEFRLLRAVEQVPPARVTAGGEAVATSGVPSPRDETAARAPFTGAPSVHTDWIVQRRKRLGTRETWENVAGGVTSTEFTLGDGAVTVRSGRNRVFSGAETFLTVEPDEPLPDEAAAFVRDHPDLPAPDEREETFRFVETRVPAAEPVTVVGTPRLGESPGQYVVDDAPPDDLLGTHADPSSEEDDAEAILIRGDAEAARSSMEKRAYWLGAAAAAMILGGQVLAFVLSDASVTAFL